MEDIQGKVFNDFEPVPSTDGSYRGAIKNKKATEKHYKMKFNQALVQANQRLKASKTRVSIECLGDALQLRATFPLKPGDTHPQGKVNKQYKISLGIPANFDGLKTAEEEAQELGKLIARKTFIWNDKYLGVQATKNNSITFREFYEQFEKKYFETRKRTLKSENTIRGHIIHYKRFFLVDVPIEQENAVKILKTIQSPAVREKCIALISIINKMLSLDMNVSECKLTIEKKNRYIPSDKEIIEGINTFEFRFSNSKVRRHSGKDNWKSYKIIYGLLATYGLRPREVINNPDLDWFISPDNKFNTFKVHKSNKTGYREVFPFVPEWVEIFDLKNIEFIEALKAFSQRWSDSATLGNYVRMVSNNFKYSKLGFTPYDLRHACAIRSHLQGMPIKASADNLGHSVEMHTQVYQQWFGLENRRKAFNSTFDSINEIDELKDEIARLRKRNVELELMLAQHELANCWKN